MNRKNIIKDKTIEFAIRIINLHKFLVDDKREFTLSKQLLRSGTAIGAMVTESEHAESKADFIHKLSVGLKEAGETKYWILLLKETEYITIKQFESINNDIDEIMKILKSIIITSKKIYH